MDLIYDKTQVNPAKLHEELKVLLGDQFWGISTGQEPGKVRVHVDHALPTASQALIAPVVEAHDPLTLTAAQLAEADRAARLDALRKPWAVWTAADRENLLRLLAEQTGIITS